ncbi:hypothetical protein F2Q65_01225 [Thiohalocapsa marina]|uniref:Uncharacterized protein n=2 Tax=Thiohalocapsa marina TaxID=424902 RepID=A0A5M8FVN4_9GAMM|nr:hypothetical protein F2Q65_01225 [Thiohalocapsa marina]
MAMRFVLALVLSASAGARAQSDAPPNADAPPAGITEQATELWQRSQQQVREAWEQSQQQAGDLLERSRSTADDWWQRSRDLTLDAWESTRDALDSQEPDPFGQVWTRVVPKLEETVALEEAQRDLPQRAWFQRDQADVQDEINALLDASVAILATSPMQQYRERLRELQEQLEATRQELDRYRQARIAAPEKSLTGKTVADYDRLIDERSRNIERLKQALAEVKRDFAAELRGIGLELDDEQVEFLLSTVVGDNIVDLGIVFDNVKAVTLQLEQLVRDSGEDLQSARRYYGMYVVLLRALNRMHLDVEQAIEQRYIPQINAIAERAEALAEDTRTLQRQHPEKRAILAGNLEAQQLTIAAAGVYRDYLKQQAAQVRQARQTLEQDIATAWNTYETVRVSGELVDLVRSSRQLLDGLLDRQVPALRPFQNLEMQREFAKLTEQLRASGGAE